MLFNQQTEAHKGVYNQPLPNMVFALSKFQGGGLLVEAPDGMVQRKIADKIYTGVVLEFSDGVSVCDAKTSCHITEAWAGDRMVLVAYAVMGTQNMAGTIVCSLSFLAFASRILRRGAGDETVDIGAR